MSSILNSISSGDLQVQQVPGEIPVKEDSIIDLLQNSEIEFKTCPHASNKLDDMNTGFGEGQELHYDIPCKKPELKTPLYKDNYLREFESLEEKAAARRALGIFGSGDIVTMDLLTAEDKKPSILEILKASTKQMRKGNELFMPITKTQAVFDKSGVQLDVLLSNVNKVLDTHQNTLDFLLSPSNNKELTSLGDVTKFLQGFNNGDNLYEALDEINQEMIRFEKTGNIN
jgi:hypothetical protein